MMPLQVHDESDEETASTATAVSPQEEAARIDFHQDKAHRIFSL